jgi:YegS/Rv2252/BmrU family lipid kinase
MGGKMIIIFNSKSGGRDNEVLVDQAREMFLPVFSKVSIMKIEKHKKIKASIVYDYDTVVAAGGDGTVNAVASLLIGTDILMGVLPLGTFNHFAGHLDIPDDFRQACDLIIKGKRQRIDVGQVNERIFLNFSFIGYYSRVAAEKEANRLKGKNKWISFFLAFIPAFLQSQNMRISFFAKGAKAEKDILFLFVGNNRYDFFGLDFLSRKTEFKASNLMIILIEKTGPLAVLLLLAKAMIGRAAQDKRFKMIGLSEFDLYVNDRNVLVGADGEVFEMQPPLRFRILPRALSVITEKDI